MAILEISADLYMHSPLKLRSRVAALRGHTDMMADKRGHKDA